MTDEEIVYKDLQEHIAVAKQQISLLKEDEQRLTRNKTAIEKTIARLSLELESIKDDHSSSLQSIEQIKKDIELTQLVLMEEQKNLASTRVDRDMEIAQMNNAKNELESALQKRSEVVVHTREVEADIEAKVAKFAEEKSSFEKRKQAVAELLMSL